MPNYIIIKDHIAQARTRSPTLRRQPLRRHRGNLVAAALPQLRLRTPPALGLLLGGPTRMWAERAVLQRKRASLQPRLRV